MNLEERGPSAPILITWGFAGAAASAGLLTAFTMGLGLIIGSLLCVIVLSVLFPTTRRIGAWVSITLAGATIAAFMVLVGKPTHGFVLAGLILTIAGGAMVAQRWPTHRPRAT